MSGKSLNGHGPASPEATGRQHELETRGAGPRDQTRADGDQAASGADQQSSDSDQTLADRDQTLSDRDQTASDQDQQASDSDQRSSDRDQRSSDRDRDKEGSDPASEAEYQATRDERERSTAHRDAAERDRARATEDRAQIASQRDQTAAARDEAARLRDARAELREATILSSHEPPARKLQQLRAQAAADRARATVDRRRAARDRAQAALDRARLDAELATAHLDGLTGAYRREMGDLALANEMVRARRGDGRFVLAYVDVDGLKLINDRDGHPAGDQVLKTVVAAIRGRLRSFDPIVRYGGDEFVCGLSGTDTAEVGRRFETIGRALSEESVAISVGLAALEEGETLDDLIARADAALLVEKRKRRA